MNRPPADFWTKASVAVGLFTGVIVLYFSYQLWVNPTEFVGRFAPPLAEVDYGSLIRARWIANRILPYGLVMLWAAYKKDYRIVGGLLLLRAGVDILDGLVLTLAMINNALGTQTALVMSAAYGLTVLNLIAAIYLLRRYPLAAR